jgi:hypothetical protein
MTKRVNNTVRQTPEPPRSLFGYQFGGSNETFVYSDERHRPTWTPKKGYMLTPEHRHQLCIHLAAHAAISHMGGANVYKLAVAPAGTRSWTTSHRKGPSLGPTWGACCTSDICCEFLKWDTHRQAFVGDRAGWEADLRRSHESSQRSIRESSANAANEAGRSNTETVSFEGVMAHRRRVLRAQTCGYLAGHVADGIVADMTADEAMKLYDRRDTQYVGVSDIVIAQGLADLLAPGEYENAVRNTEETLRCPEVWELVNQLAEQLKNFGLLEGDECEVNIRDYMPPRLANWPPALD